MHARLLAGTLIAAAAAAPHALAPAPAPAAPPATASATAAPNAFGSLGLRLGDTRYSARWRRVAGAGSGRLRDLVQPARALAVPAKAEFVNSALNRRIRYRFDAHPSGDQWATAGETLSRGAGDCEDYVIAKMHALRALGVPARDLYMTIGHDASAGIAHAVLLVRAGSQLLVLDNRSDRMVPEAAYRHFYPIISFSAAGDSWLHGYPRGMTPAYVRGMSASFADGRHALGNSEASRRPRRA